MVELNASSTRPETAARLRKNRVLTKVPSEHIWVVTPSQGRSKRSKLNSLRRCDVPVPLGLTPDALARAEERFLWTALNRSRITPA